MSELDDRLDEARATVATMGPPDDLWARVIERTGDVEVIPLASVAQHRPRSLWLVAAAAVVLLVALVGAVALLDDDQTVDTKPATEPSTVPGPPTTLALTDLAKGRQFRVANVTVTIQCTTTNSTPDSATRELVLGGVVAANPDAVATLDDVSVAMGDLLALIIRDDPDLGRRVTLYDNTQWYGGATISSCDELVESVPTWVDGGFFNGGIPGGYEVLLDAATSDP